MVVRLKLEGREAHEGALLLTTALLGACALIRTRAVSVHTLSTVLLNRALLERAVACEATPELMKACHAAVELVDVAELAPHVMNTALDEIEANVKKAAAALGAKNTAWSSWVAV